MIHPFTVKTVWTGNRGEGTKVYNGYERHHTISVEGKENIYCSSDPAFLGDGTKYNPEDFFVASLATCHMLWYFHLCADAGVIVTEYSDESTGTLDTGLGKFTEVILRPKVRVADESMIALANELHKQAHQKCFIANSTSIHVICEAESYI